MFQLVVSKVHGIMHAEQLHVGQCKTKRKVGDAQYIHSLVQCGSNDAALCVATGQDACMEVLKVTVCVVIGHCVPGHEMIFTKCFFEGLLVIWLFVSHWSRLT